MPRRGRAIAPVKTARPPARTISGVGGKPIRVVGKAAKDPRFTKVMQRIEMGAVKLKTHPHPAQKAAEAQAAALPAPKEKSAGAQVGQVDEMKDAKTKKPESNSFLALLRSEIEKVMPKTNDEAEKFMEGGEKQQLKGSVSGNVNQQKEEAAGPLKAASEATPDSGSIPEKEVQPIPGEAPTPVPTVQAGEAMPAPKPDAEINARRDDAKSESEKKMQSAEITPEQMQKANDPRFTAVLDKKATVAKVADAGPAQFKTGEGKVLTEAVAKAQGAGQQGMAAAVGVKGRAGTAVKSRQQIAKERDEARRKEVTSTIENIFNETKTRVEAKLNGLEGMVNAMFDAGTEAALNKMKTDSEREIKKFKKERYSGLIGAGRWIADLFSPTHPEIKRILERARQTFSSDMDTVIIRVANTVDQQLAQAKAEIDRGQARIKSYVDSLPRDLQGVGRAAQQDVAGRFDELRNSVDEKKNDLAQKLAERYKDAQDKADTELKKIEDANKGALFGLVEAIGEVIKVLTEFKNKLMSILRKGVETIKLILADPIGFLKNLLAAIKGGIQKFVDNIWTHLKKAFMQWLFGSLADAGIELPTDLSLPSILKLVLGVLGITYARMRQKAVKLLGPTAVAIIEKLVQYVQALITGGPAALWEQIKEDLGNLKAMVIDAIQNWLIETIIKQAVLKIVSMFNPAGALIQAIMAIYNVVMFVIEKAQQIMAFVEAVVNSVHAIATGAIGGAIDWIEQSLARILPLVIGFLARLIGLGGISKKIKEFITKIQTKVDQAIDKVLAKIVNVVKKLFGRGGKPPATNPDALSGEVKTALIQQLQSPHSKKDANKSIQTVQGQFKAQGLKKIDVSPVNQAGEQDVFTEINPKKKIGRIVPTKSKGRTRMFITMTLAGSAPAFPSFPNVPGTGRLTSTAGVRDERGNVFNSVAIINPVSGVTAAGRGTSSRQREQKSRPGGVILPQAAGSKEIEARTWSTGDEPNSNSNATHAERQFEEWLKKQPLDWRKRVESISLRIEKSPCKLCSRTLSNVYALLPNVKTASLTYDSVYTTPPNATTKSSISGIAGWNVSGPPIPDEETVQLNA